MIGGIGIIRLSREWLKEALQKSKKVNIIVTGILVVDKSVTAQLLEDSVENVKVYGKIQAQPDILAILKSKESR